MNPSRQRSPEVDDLRIGVDLGGTKIEIVALDSEGNELFRHREPTPTTGYKSVVDKIGKLVELAESRIQKRATVGVGTPGSISKVTGLLKNSNSICLNGHPLRQDLETKLARQILIANDANCFALSEAVDGAGAEAAVVFGVIAGTGTGGGIVVHGRVLQGINGIAGEWGHNPLPWPTDEERYGPLCYCGKRGCIETFLSGPGMARIHANETGEMSNPLEIARRAENGDAVCRRSMDRYEDRLARSLSSVINVLDPGIIVLGGGMSNISRLYQNVPGIWGRYIFSDHVGTRLLPPVHGDSSGVRGAAWLWGVPGRYHRSRINGLTQT